MNVMNLRWDSHACLPLHPNASIRPLLRYKEAGVHYLSVNIGMDMNPISQILSTLASFRTQIKKTPNLHLVTNFETLREHALQGDLTIGFDIEGALPLLERPELIDLYHTLGVRQIHLAYNRNNSAAGGCHDTPQGLTVLGRQLVDVMNQVGMIVDCSHMSKKSSLEVIERSSTPPVFSHANVARLVPHQRNIDDDQIRAIGCSQGVICLNGVGIFLGDGPPTRSALVKHIKYIADLIGAEHVGVGLDISFSQHGIDDCPPPPFDSSYWWPASAGYRDGISEVRYLPPETWIDLPNDLISAGFSLDETQAILGGNMARILTQVENGASQSETISQ